MARIKQVRCADETLRDFLTQGFDGHIRCIEGLPEGAEPAGMLVPPPRRRFEISLLYEHESFEDVAPGEPIPEIQVVFKTIYDELSEEPLFAMYDELFEESLESIRDELFEDNDADAG